MPTVLLVADRPSVIDRVHAALASVDVVLIDHELPGTAADAAYEFGVDRVVVDQQVGAMGAMAVARSIRSKGFGDPIPVTILLDRAADAFLAGRSGADNWVHKDDLESDLRSAVLSTEAVS